MSAPAPDIVNQAASAYRSGDFGLAESSCRDALRADPAQPELALMLSGLLIRRQSLDEAEQCLAEAIKAMPDEPRLKANLGIVLDKQGRHDQAIAVLQPLVDSHPQLLSAWNALAVAQLNSNQPEAAVQVLRRGLEHHPGHPVLSLHLARAESAAGKSDRGMMVYADFAQMSGQLVQEAESLAQRGQFGEAELRYRNLLQVDKGNAMIHGGLGRLLLRMGRIDEARDSLQRALEFDPDDITSRHFLAACGEGLAEGSAPAYVRKLFDRYAEDFDQSLTEELGYRIPWLVAEIFSSLQPKPQEILDLGCGTGLVGHAMSDRGLDLDGVDLSEAMLDKARQRRLYRRVVQAEIVDFLEQSADTWEAIVAADVLIYLGELDRLMTAVARRLRPGGWFCFSVESSAGPDVELHPGSGRFRHSDEYLARSLAAAGLSLDRADEVVVRSEFGQPIAGRLILARLS
ncbi:MAG: tetratricopeptide repeat protein [Wenzhouxiangella sp.]|nr:tetratricopeptide repeat protein [Wenzhouxiangella sp.]MCH8477159.1 tetratricopeptide repeat protein [Wenzhouxiangella sp.]TVR97157.1 MAG: tetratricopeptide repeat protein [Wenzhouxiangellaceae bacterium]